MKYATRLAYARMMFLIDEKKIRQQFCVCRAPIDSFISPEIQAAMDAFADAVASEPADECPGGVAD